MSTTTNAEYIRAAAGLLQMMPDPLNLPEHLKRIASDIERVEREMREDAKSLRCNNMLLTARVFEAWANMLKGDQT